MQDSADIVKAINRLTEVVSSDTNSYLPMVVSTALATIGSILAVLIVDKIRSYYFRPTEDFEKRFT